MCSCEITEHLRGTWLHPPPARNGVITAEHSLHSAFGITALQRALTKAASKRVFMKCNVQLKGEGGSSYNSPSLLLQGRIFFPRYITLASFIYLQLRHKASECWCSLTLISHCTLLCCAVLLYNKAESRECLMRLQKRFVPA